MRSRLAFPTLAALVLAASAAAAQPKSDAPKSDAPKADSKKADAPKADKADAKKSDKKAEAPKAAGPREIPKDPENKRGISPYMEAIARGQANFVARDLAGAVAAFQDAIKLDTDRMLGFFRLGEAQLEAGKPEEAEIAWTTALGKKGSEDMNAKLLFVIADLRERQKKWKEAKDAWGAYTSFLQGHATVAGFPAVAIERQKVIDQRVKDEVEYGKVKERIAARQAEREAEALENAKKDKLNK